MSGNIEDLNALAAMLEVCALCWRLKTKGEKCTGDHTQAAVEAIRERLEAVGAEITKVGRSKGAEWEASAEGECAGLEFALRALGVADE